MKKMKLPFYKLNALLCGKHFALTITLLFMCCMQYRAGATAWVTTSAGTVTTLSNWTNGSTSPSTFLTPGDTWTIRHAMTLSSTWTLGTSATPTDTLTIVTGGSIALSSSSPTANIYGCLNMNGGQITMSGAGSTAQINVFANYTMTGGKVNMAGAGTNLTINVTGLYTMTNDTLSTSSAGGILRLNARGGYRMSGGVTVAGGAGATLSIYAYGDFSMTGSAAMISNGAGTYSFVHLALPSASGTMMVENTSTGTWSGTNVYLDTNCTAQLVGNFSTTTGSTTYGFIASGKLIVPAAFIVNGTRIFKLDGSGTLVVAAPTGINGAITSTGTITLDPSASFEYNGSAAQVTGSMLPANLTNPSILTINNTTGVTLSRTTTSTGRLQFTNGVLHTATYTLTLPGAATAVSGAATNSYVDGLLIKTISGLSSVNFETGNTTYAPLLLTFNSAGTGGNLGVKVTHGLHPNVATSGLNTSFMANNYWAISNYSASGPGTITPMATYESSDIIGGSNMAFVCQQYVSSSWLGTPVSTVNTTSPNTSTLLSGIPLSTVAGDYIFGNPPCSTLPIGGPTTVCEGATITLTNATSGGTWSSGTASVATISATGVVTGISGGTTVITYTASGCPVFTTITVQPLPVPGIITGVTSVCLGLTTNLTDTVAGGVWSSSAALVASVSTTGVVTGITAGSATISYTVTNSCGSASATISVTVASTLVVAAITGADSVCPARTITMSSATGGGTWSVTNSTNATITATGIVTGLVTGYDTVVYTITNSCGTASAKKRIRIRNAALCAAGVELNTANTDAGILVYPNPNSGTFSIEVPAVDEGEMHVQIMDLLGRTINEFKTKPNIRTEVTLNCPPGVYLVKTYSNGLQLTTRIIVEQ